VRACVCVCVREGEPHCRAQSLSRLCSPRLFANNDSENRNTHTQKHTHTHTHTLSTHHAITFKKKFGLATGVVKTCIIHSHSCIGGKQAHDPRINTRRAAGKHKNPAATHVCLHSGNTLERADIFAPVCDPLSISWEGYLFCFSIFIFFFLF
jgi:hypothetical protein